MLDLTVVVCTYNVQSMIKDCLESIKRNGPQRIILIDGGSTDNTRSISKDYVDDVLHDGARGLANARNLGIEHCLTKYICFVGPDNIMPPGSLEKMIHFLEEHNCAIVSAVTILRDTNCYWGWAQNIYRINKYTPGYKDVVGTPTLFKTSIAKKYKYDPFMKNSDDTEICSRMARDGLRFAISDTVCYEIGFDNLSSVVERWTRYGRGDYLFYERNKQEWKLTRKIQSWYHPFVHDFLIFARRLKFRDMGIYPFLFIILGLRYWGWFKSRITHIERYRSVYHDVA